MLILDEEIHSHWVFLPFLQSSLIPYFYVPNNFHSVYCWFQKSINLFDSLICKHIHLKQLILSKAHLNKYNLLKHNLVYKFKSGFLEIYYLFFSNDFLSIHSLFAFSLFSSSFSLFPLFISYFLISSIFYYIFRLLFKSFF